MTANEVGEAVQPVREDPLVGPGAVLDDGYRRGGRCAPLYQPRGDPRRTGDAHVHHDRAPGLGERAPVGLGAAGAAVPGDQRHGVC